MYESVCEQASQRVSKVMGVSEWMIGASKSSRFPQHEQEVVCANTVKTLYIYSTLARQHYRPDCTVGCTADCTND